MLDLGVAHVGRQREHHLIYIDAFCMPKHHAPDSEGVPHVMKAWRIMCATVDPTKAVAQCGKDAMHLSFAERLPQSLATATDKERCIEGRGNVPSMLPPIVCQRYDSAGMQRKLARLGELGLPYDQHPSFEINIGITQMNRLGDTQSGRGHQPE